jgi:glyoxylate/hydroxypyruvate reductase A
LVVTLPLTAESRGMIGRQVLSACRGAVLMNAGRGAVVDEGLIPEALDRGWLSAAVLDVFETEPLPSSSPLWADPRVMISPHISGLTTTEGAVQGFLECLEELERGRLPARTVDRDRGY